MRALVCRGGLHYESGYPEPELETGEVLVRVRQAGICNTDLEILRGYMDFQGVLGHEFVGAIAGLGRRVPAQAGLQVGQRVVGDINAACYACPTCLAGRHTHCPNRTTLGIYRRDGAFADYLTLPWLNLHPVPDAVPDEIAVFVEPLAAACQIVAQVKISPTDRVIVLGDGKLGLLAAAVLRLTGASLALVGRHAEKLAIARAWGVRTLGPEATLHGVQADVVVECTGVPEGFALARRLLRPAGVLVLKSTYRPTASSGQRGDDDTQQTQMLDMSSLVVDEITLVGSRCGPFAPALRLLESRLVDPRPLISAAFRLAEGAAAFERAARPEALKVLLTL